MKKLDKFILTSFIGPYILSFFIAEFVLIMQFLWKYIDDILGKGFTMFDVLELIAYYGMTIIPMALPISILLASIMVFGDISEKYELASMKSAGISLLRIMRPAIFLAIATAGASLISSNYVKPAATFQFKKRFDLIKRQKSTLTIEDGIFNGEFRDFAIRVANKEADEKTVNDVIIYDHTSPDRSLVNLIKSDCGEMYSTEDGNYFVMNLKEGEQYQELERRVEDGKMTYPFVRTEFHQWNKVFDMSNFYLNESDISINRNREDMLNTFQLLTQIDSFDRKIESIYGNIQKDINKIMKSELLSKEKYKIAIQRNADKSDQQPVLPAPKIITVNVDSLKAVIESLKKRPSDPETALMIKAKEMQLKGSIKRNLLIPNHPASLSLIQNKNTPVLNATPSINRKPDFNIKRAKYFYESLDSTSLNLIIDKAVINFETHLNAFGSISHNLKHSQYQKEVYLLRLGQQYSFALVCVLFLFIGAPLGSIIRKGGYGYPLLVAILFYMLFIISTIVGEKLLKSETVTGLLGAWMPCLILLPFSFYFTYLALNDARFLWIEKLGRFFTKLFTPKESKVITA